MGGRGASSGKSNKNKPYGSEFRSLLRTSNIKFVQKTSHDSEMFETMTRGRVYAEINQQDEVKTIYYFDNNLKKIKNIDLRHPHKKMMPHTHHGYEHASEDGTKGAANLTPEEQRMVDFVLKTWYNHRRKS